MTQIYRTLGPELFARRRGAMRLGPDSEGPAAKKMKLLIIDCDARMVERGRELFREACDIPDELRHVQSVEEAKALVDHHGPDIILSGRRIGEDLYGCNDVLYHAKTRDPGTIVILWCDFSRGGNPRESSERAYDAIVDSRNTNEVCKIVGYYCGVDFGGESA